MALAVLSFAAFAIIAADDGKKDDRKADFDLLFVPTPPEVVDKMLELAKVTKDDVVYDLFAGDGRIVFTAAKKYQCKAVGFDVDPDRIKACQAERAKLDPEAQKLISFQKKDLFKVDLSDATVVMLYLVPELNIKLIPQLKKMKKGSRIVSHAFDIPGVKEDKHVTVKCNDGQERDLYLWTLPLTFTKGKE